MSKDENANKVTQDTSDGYHTFRELYEHRRMLTKNLFNLDYKNCFKSKLHNDGKMFENYFIVGIRTAKGCATYHYHIRHWDDFKGVALERAPEWDGHTSGDAINRIDFHFGNLEIARHGKEGEQDNFIAELMAAYGEAVHIIKDLTGDDEEPEIFQSEAWKSKECNEDLIQDSDTDRNGE